MLVVLYIRRENFPEFPPNLEVPPDVSMVCLDKPSLYADSPFDWDMEKTNFSTYVYFNGYQNALKMINDQSVVSLFSELDDISCVFPIVVRDDRGDLELCLAVFKYFRMGEVVQGYRSSSIQNIYNRASETIATITLSSNKQIRAYIFDGWFVHASKATFLGYYSSPTATERPPTFRPEITIGSTFCVSKVDNGYGSLGGIVTKTEGRDVYYYLLTCQHVLENIKQRLQKVSELSILPTIQFPSIGFRRAQVIQCSLRDQRESITSDHINTMARSYSDALSCKFTPPNDVFAELLYARSKWVN